jgi:iron complex transport system substrate-binding protein
MNAGQISHWQTSPLRLTVARSVALPIIIIAAAALGLTACRKVEPAPQERASAGTSSDVAAPRLVALTPSASEVVAALGATPLLVGVDEYTTYPAEATRLPRVGTFLEPNVESILRLRPSLVIIDDVHTAVAAQLRDLKIATVACPMHTLEDVRSSLLAVGERLGRGDTARALVTGIDAAVAAARARRHDDRPRVMAVIDREPTGLGYLVVAGPGSWLDELLGIVGADNALATAPARYPKLSLEEVLRAAPEIIVDTTFGADPAQTARDWAPAARIPAVAHGRVTVLKEPYFMSPSPRVALALTELDRIVHAPAAPTPAPPP